MKDIWCDRLSVCEIMNVFRHTARARIQNIQYPKLFCFDLEWFRFGMVGTMLLAIAMNGPFEN